MTALIGTGHSIDQKNDHVKGNFRPEADVAARKIDAASMRQRPKYWLVDYTGDTIQRATSIGQGASEIGTGKTS